MICAIYARVSTEEQNSDIQLAELRAYCERSKWTISKEYVDHLSGKSGERDAFKRLFLDATRRKFDVVLVWALDRFTREGVFETFDYIRKLTDQGIKFESYTEPHFRTTGPAGELMLAIAAWIAKQERLRIQARTVAGVRHAQKHGTRSGKDVGRQRVIFDRARAHHLREDEHWSLRKIAAELGVSHVSISNELNSKSLAQVQDGPLD